jgi:cell division protein FtsL
MYKKIIYEEEYQEIEYKDNIIDAKKLTIMLLIGIVIYAIIDTIIIINSGYHIEF